VYSCKEDACEFCARRNLTCVKVLGPKARATTQETTPAIEEQPFALPSRASTTDNSGRSDQESFDHRSPHQQGCNAPRDDRLTIALQQLWNAFTNKSLSYSALADSHYRRNPFDLPVINQHQEFNFSIKDLITAIGKREASEYHLVSLSLALLINNFGPKLEVADIQDVIRRLETLIKDSSHSHIARNSVCKVFSLYHFLLSVGRRAQFQMFHTPHNEMAKASLREMQQISGGPYIAGAVHNSRIAHDRSTELDLLGLAWDLNEDAMTLFACFNQKFCGGIAYDEGSNSNFDPTHSMSVIETNLKTLSSLTYFIVRSQTSQTNPIDC